MDSLRVTVQSVRALHPEIRAFTLSPLPGQTLPPFEAGAHVRVRVKGQDEWREYSLIDGVNDQTADTGPGKDRFGQN